MSKSIENLLLLAGAARSGTTALAEALGTHPSISLSTPKEPHFLARGAFDKPAEGVHGKLFDEMRIVEDGSYLRAFDFSGAYFLDGSVSSLPYAELAIPEARRLAENLHVAVMLRDPVARLISNYKYMRSRGREDLSLADALAEEESRRSAGWPFIYRYRWLSTYSSQLARLNASTTEGETQVFLYEDYSGRFDLLGAEICQKLGLDPTALGASESARNASAGSTRSATMARIWEESVRRVPDSLRTPKVLEVGRAVRNTLLMTDVSDPQIEAMQDQLYSEFQPEIERCSDVLGRDLHDIWQPRR